MRKKFLWPHLKNDVYQTVSTCKTWGRSREGLEHKRHLHLFPGSGPVLILAIDILGPQPQLKNGNKHFFVIKGRNWKLTRVISSSKTTVTHTATLLLDHWIVPCGIPDGILMDSGLQFLSNDFLTQWGLLAVRHMMKTAYQFLTNPWVEKNKKR